MPTIDQILSLIAQYGYLELPPIGWQLFILGSSQSYSTAFPTFLDTCATRLLAEPLSGFGAVLYTEYALLAAIFGLVAAHGGYFGRRLVRLAAAERRTESAEEARAFVKKRRSLQRLSLWVSWVNVLISVAVAALAVSA